MLRKISAILVMIMLVTSAALFLGACGHNEEGITSLDQLNQQGIKIGVSTDTTEYTIVEKEFPKAEIVYAKDLMFALTSVAQGSIDAFVGNKLNLELAIANGQKGIRLMDESVGEGNVAAHSVIEYLSEKEKEQ